MDEPSNPVDGESEGAAAARPEPAIGDELTTEWYETEDGFVLYDADNPLAWIQASEMVHLEEMA